MSRLVGFFVGCFALCVLVFAVLFLGGLCSAYIEVRRERAAGLVPTRPADDLRDKRRAVGGTRERARIAWRSAVARAQGWHLCWCGRGAVMPFTATDNGYGEAGIGCAAWEAGDPLAILRHDAAGGYARVSEASAL